MSSSSSQPTAKDIAAMIDHTLLKPDATTAQIEQLCHEARMYEFASVCVNPCFVNQCAKLLHDVKNKVKVCTVVGFPLGANTTTIKVGETRQAIADGATEIDMVIRVSAIKDNDWTTVQKDIAAVVQAAKEGTGGDLGSTTIVTKVILETCLLTDDEIRKACQVAVAAGADFVKTSTGFSKGGATVPHITLMRETVGPTVGVKASGGVRTLADALAMIDAGATRIGASAGVQIVQQVQQGGDGVEAQEADKAAGAGGGGGY